jgi:hypothetical protein
MKIKNSDPMARQLIPSIANKLKGLRFHQSCAILITLIIAGSAFGQQSGATPPKTWNLADDFKISSNPSGQWSYGSTPSVGGAFTVFARTAQIPYQVSHGAVAEWVGTYFSGFELFPYVTKFYGDPGTTVSVTNACNAVTCSIENPGVTIVERSADGVGVHPAPPGLGYATIRWTAPASNTYFFTVSFFSIDVNVGATTDVHVLRNSVSLFSGFVNGIGSVQNWSTGTAGIALTAGDVIDLVVGPNGDFGSDSTGVDAEIQQGPPITLEVNSCVDYANFKIVPPSNTVSSEVSPDTHGVGQPAECAVPATLPSSWSIKTTVDGGKTWQWQSLASLGLGK